MMETWLHFIEREGSLDIPPETACARLNGDMISRQDELLDAIAMEMRFPDYFGRNWDALYDILTDEDWMPAGPCCIVWTNASNLLRNSVEDFLTALEVFESAYIWWKEHDKVFTVRIVDRNLLSGA